MIRKNLPFNTNLKTEYPGLKQIMGVEGGCYYYVMKDGKHLIISDYGTMADFFLDDKDQLNKLTTEYEFDSKEECRDYILNKFPTDKLNNN